VAAKPDFYVRRTTYVFLRALFEALGADRVPWWDFRSSARENRGIKTAVRAPNMREYAAFFNHARPHQGIGQRIPDGALTRNANGHIAAHQVLGGLHHAYRRAA